MQQILNVFMYKLVCMCWLNLKNKKIILKKLSEKFCWVKGNHAQSMLSIKMQVEIGDNTFYEHKL